MERIDLNDMRFFVAVVQAGSLTKAAEHLGIPKSRLSRRLTELETQLGSKLLDRGRFGVRLNELGEVFYRHASMMLDCAENAQASVQQALREPHGTLRISVSVEILHGFLTPFIAEYLYQYGGVSLDIQMDNRQVNMLQEGIDIALRIGEVHQEEVVAKLAGYVPVGLYASANFLQNSPPIARPEDLESLPLLNKTDGVAWTLNCDEKRYTVKGTHRVSSNDAYVLAQLAEDGMGIALLPEIGKLVPKTLIRVLPEWAPTPSPLHVIYYKNRGLAPLVRSFVDFLIVHFPKR